MYELRDDGGFSLLGDPRQVEMQNLKERLLDALTDDWQTARELLDMLDEPKPSIRYVQQTLAVMACDGLIDRDPPYDEGTKPGKSYRWRGKFVGADLSAN